MTSLSIDLETKSGADIKKEGMYRYVEDPEFEILLFIFSRDGEYPICVDLTAFEEIPADVVAALWDDTVKKYAYNAPFEIECLGKHFGKPMIIQQWYCTMVKAAMCGLPIGLAQVGMALKLDMQKDIMGMQLIRYFCIPCKPTKTNGGRTWNMPWHDPVKWEAFKKYGIRDVIVEQSVALKLEFYTIPDKERALWFLDQAINRCGMLVDLQLVRNAIQGDNNYRERLIKEAVELTGLQNPNSNNQLKEWLQLEINEEVSTLKKEAIPDLIKGTDDTVVKRVLTIRTELNKTSVKKYTSMTNVVCKDNRIRGLFQYVGANRTLRFAGRLTQLQNFPRSELKDLDLARELVQDNDFDTLEMLYGNVPDTLSQLLRTAFVAPPGKKFIVADFSNIELVVAAWLAGEQWVLDEFNGERKIYEQTAARMLRVPVKDIKKGSPERQKGKIASLACQYGGSVGALEKMGALRMGLKAKDLPGIVEQWRHANPNIVRYWKILEDAAIRCVQERVTVKLPKGINFQVQKGVLFVDFPYGVKLAYVHPKVVEGKFGGPALRYEGMDQTSKQWKDLDTYGGKLFENFCQKIARDVLADAMLRLNAAGYPLVAHIHDEVVAEVNEDENHIEKVVNIMSQPLAWAPGLPLAAEGFENKFYRK